MRLFFALSVADNVISELDVFRARLKEPWRLVRADQMHITLAFLGDKSDEELENIIRIGNNAAQRIRSFSIQIVETGTFPDAKDPKVLFASVKNSDELTGLHKAIIDRLENYNDSFPFIPHVTLARCRLPGAKAVKTKLNLSWKATSLILFKSELTSKGPVYEVVDQSLFCTNS